MQWMFAPGSIGGNGGLDLAACVAKRGVQDAHDVPTGRGVFSSADTNSLEGVSPSLSVVVVEDVP